MQGRENLKIMYKGIESSLAESLQVTSEEYEVIIATLLDELKEFETYHESICVHASKKN